MRNLMEPLGGVVLGRILKKIAFFFICILFTFQTLKAETMNKKGIEHCKKTTSELAILGIKSLSNSNCKSKNENLEKQKHFYQQIQEAASLSPLYRKYCILGQIWSATTKQPKSISLKQKEEVWGLEMRNRTDVLEFNLDLNKEEAAALISIMMARQDYKLGSDCLWLNKRQISIRTLDSNQANVMAKLLYEKRKRVFLELRSKDYDQIQIKKNDTKANLARLKKGDRLYFKSGTSLKPSNPSSFESALSGEQILFRFENESNFWYYDKYNRIYAIEKK